MGSSMPYDPFLGPPPQAHPVWSTYDLEPVLHALHTEEVTYFLNGCLHPCTRIKTGLTWRNSSFVAMLARLAGPFWLGLHVSRSIVMSSVRGDPRAAWSGDLLGSHRIHTCTGL